VNYEDLSMSGSNLKSQEVIITFLDDSRLRYLSLDFDVRLNPNGMLVIRSKKDDSLTMYPYHCWKKLRMTTVVTTIARSGDKNA